MTTASLGLHILRRILPLAAYFLYMEVSRRYKPDVEVLATEKALESLLKGDQFVVFGLFNSLVCTKCMSLFTKMQKGFQNDAQLSQYPFKFTAIDRARFAKSGQKLEYAQTANMLMFYSRKRIYFFPEFIRMAHAVSMRRQFHRDIVFEARKFLEGQIKLLRRLESLEDVIEAVGREGIIAVFLGGQGVQFRSFRDIVMEHLDLPLFYIDDARLAQQVFAYYAGFWTELSDTIAVFKRVDKISTIDPEAYGLVPWDPSPAKLLRRLLIEMSPKLQADPPQEFFVKTACSGVPMVLFVESARLDPKRTEKVKAWLDFLQLAERIFVPTVLSSSSTLLHKNQVLEALRNHDEDRVFVLVNPKGDGFDHAKLHGVTRDFTRDNLVDQVETILFNERMAPLHKPHRSELTPKAMQMLKNFLMGKTFDLPKQKDFAA